ncbi:uncharacterized protein HMPREF1541_07625 [Cyphellophora europaea CBS 101466]|uniref:HMA domain-containing protein n=1 Tax=Cyphellophora europaea (strain CBS 101466) TaxID=1220924 RepID=W2RNG4_CYPE1|nr:uncharacterized protein HMPREF1541_07625 [Cyphellophora europaea CBS 101466]ETN38002.1 hypothetical protein HMPREF1541_07625 [Cyphellophora europaea CBS 101466]
MRTAVLLVSNIHCPSCVCLIQDVFSRKAGILSNADVSLIAETVRISYDENVTSFHALVDALVDAAFEVRHVTVADDRGAQVEDQDLIPDSIPTSSRWDRMWRRARQDHIDNCDACQSEQRQMSTEKSRARTWATIVRSRKNGSSISGRSSALSSAGTAVDNPAVINVDGPPSRDDTAIYKAAVALEGMTCGSCVGAITRGVQHLPYVSSVNVDLLTNSGTFEVKGRANVDQLLESIEDLGYGASLVTLIEPETAPLNPQERIIELQIDGMHCQNCPDRVKEALEGLADATVAETFFKILKTPSLKDPKIQIAYKPRPAKGQTARRFVQAIEAVDTAFTVYVYHAPTLEERSRHLQHAERMSILWRLIFTGMLAIPTLIIGVVFMALVPKHNKTRQWFEQPLWAGNTSRLEWSLFIITTPVMFYGADIFHRRAFNEIWQMWRPGSSFPLSKRILRFGSMNLLISAATMVAYISSLAVLIMSATSTIDQQHHTMSSSTYFDAVTFLTFFILIGRFLEAYSKAKTGDAVTLLGKLRPSEAFLIEQGIRKIPVDQLEVDDLVQIPRGHSPPADGVVEQDGSSSFDESSLTGESKPVSKIKGDTVYSGTVNVADPVEVRVTGLGGSSMLDQIIDVVRGGQAKRAPIERFADVLTGYFVPVITLLAVTTWLIWLGLGTSSSLPRAWLGDKQGGWAFWSLEFAIAVFVIACPCGIGLAAPTALFVGGGLAAKQGILVQGGGQAFQEASRLDSIVFDKTGTLTQGEMKVTDFEQLSDVLHKDVLLAISRSLENISSHPIAQAIATYCSSSTAELALADVKEVPGQGMIGTVTLKHGTVEESFHAAIGNESLLSTVETASITSLGEATTPQPSTAGSANFFCHQSLRRHQIQGHSVAILAVRPASSPHTHYQPAALFALSDPLRPEVASVLASLRSQGLSVHMCTGDNATTASAIAASLSIPASHVRAGVLPQGKAAYIHELQHEHQPTTGSSRRRVVAFVGDGLNDTPALTAADVSISLSSGSDIAITASSFILLNPSLRTITSLLSLSRRVFLRVKLNFFWALLYNCVLIPVAAGVFYPVGATAEHGGWRLGPVWAAVAMACSSVSVVASSLALRLPEVKFETLFGRRRT